MSGGGKKAASEVASPVFTAARARYRALGRALATCRGEAAVYAACVETNLHTVQKGTCAIEFEALLQCTKKAGKAAAAGK